MNYLTEINLFYKWLGGNSISGNSQALWHRLMAYCNEFGWKDEFTITNGRLAEDLSISKKELDRIRNILCQKKIIEYKKGGGNQCGTYKMVSFACQNNANPDTQTVTQTGHKEGYKVYSNGTQSVPLNKLNKNKTKQDEYNTPSKSDRLSKIDF